MSDRTNAQRLAKILEDHIPSDDTNEAAAELRRLEAENQNMDRLLRCSVPDRWKSCTSPVGAAQNYIAELEISNAELLEALKACAAVCAGETISKNGLISALEKARAAIVRAAAMADQPTEQAA